MLILKIVYWIRHFGNMSYKFKMGLKPPHTLRCINPFTEGNGNSYINSNSSCYSLPSALADGFHKSLLEKALATY